MAEKDKVIEILRSQTGNMMQLVGKHCQITSALQLEKEINNRRLELQELRILKDKMDAKIQELGLRSELEQTRNTLKSMEGSDGHAVKAVMGMQKQTPEKQGQEQDSVHLKLQHTLEVKELQGPGYTSNSSLKPRVLYSSAAHSHSNIPSSQATASFASHHSMKSNTVRENPTRDLKQLLQELSSVVNEEPPVPPGKTEEDERTPSLGVSHVAVSNSSLRDSTHSSKSTYSGNGLIV
ncbi:hypothetical protein MC885_012374 [Smutsia gigantea]|nr:hypothetical protein MC885_012374 [Smutsia gigantea]